MPGGHLSIDEENDELIYSGPNIMLGYTKNHQELTGKFSPPQVLRTGDLARINENGFFEIIGRLKRVIKISGMRYSLDDIEDVISEAAGIGVCASGGDDQQ